MTLLTEHAELDELGGGRFRQQINPRAIAYRRDGSLRRITNALGATGDPGQQIGVDELVQFRVANKLAGQSPILHFGKGNANTRLTALGTNNGVNAVVSGQAVTYPNAWNNADLRLTIGGHRLYKEVLLRAGHPASFSFRIDGATDFDQDTLSGPEFWMLPPSLTNSASPMVSIPLSWVKTQQGGKRILTVTLPAGNYAGWVLDPTISLQPDAADGKDVRLVDGVYATHNFGVTTTLSIGMTTGIVFRGLLAFPLATLPASAILNAVTVSLYCMSDYSSNARTLRVYRQKRAWLEGTRDDAVDVPATGATWNRYDLTNNWATAGGFGADDCEQTDIGSRDFTASETLNEFKAISLTPVTKAALDLGNGWLLKMDTENSDMYNFASSDNATAANRPKLEVTYTVLPTMQRAPGWGRWH